MLVSCMISHKDETPPPPERAYPPDAGVHGLPPADAFEDDVYAFTNGVVPNFGGYGSAVHGPIDGKVGAKFERFAALGLRPRHDADLWDAVNVLEQLNQTKADAIAPVHEAALRLSLVHAAHLGGVDGRRDAAANGSGVDHVQIIRQDDGIARRSYDVSGQPPVGNEAMLGLQSGAELLLPPLAPAAGLGSAPDVVVVHDALPNAIWTDVGSDGRDDTGRLVAQRQGLHAEVERAVGKVQLGVAEGCRLYFHKYVIGAEIIRGGDRHRFERQRLVGPVVANGLHFARGGGR
mmetsp:Transcript_25646/g.74204  ORF Transcript_25646/g.74204 Transcript_25646/m.74204 type:complete len:291 (-) Transcript_25646:35-907(-)